MPDGTDARDREGRNRPADPLVVEGAQVLLRPATATHDAEIHPAKPVHQPERPNQGFRGLGALDPRGDDQELDR